MFSIIIPTFNNLKYLKLCLKSIRKNSKFDHEIIPHVNVGDDGTLEYLNEEKINYSYTKHNSGICEGVNKAARLSTTNYILYAHDDFYFCPRWDEIMYEELKKFKNNLFYLSGYMIEKKSVNNQFGENIENFKEDVLLKNFDKIKIDDFQGSTWAPHLIHKDIWNKIGGLSEEYYPGTGSDPDLNKKLWDIGVRIFKGLGQSKVYHFGSIVTRRVNRTPNILTESGSKGGKIFLLKWGMSIKFFKKFYLESNNYYVAPLREPNKSLNFLFNLLLCKVYYFYIKTISLFKKKSS